jgi:hypothetical protein
MSAYRKPDRCAWCCARLTPANTAVVGPELVCRNCAEGYTMLRPEDRERDTVGVCAEEYVTIGEWGNGRPPRVCKLPDGHEGQRDGQGHSDNPVQQQRHAMKATARGIA